MNRRLLLPLLICALMLAGCYRQADDEFEQIDSQSLESLVSPTLAINPSETEDASAQGAEETSTVTNPLLTPSKTDDPAQVEVMDEATSTPTVRIPATSNSALLPTATPIQLELTPTELTPESVPPQVEQPTINPLPTATPTFDISQPTPTEISDAMEAGDECIHEVVSGDTLFRIGLNNGTTVEAIQQLNSIEGDGIQVGQLLRIPDCVPGQAAADEPDEETETVVRPTVTSSVGGSSVATVEPAVNIPAAGQQIHVVVSGETLGAIATRYGTTISAIVELNQLGNPDALAIGDELLIPARN